MLLLNSNSLLYLHQHTNLVLNPKHPQFYSMFYNSCGNCAILFRKGGPFCMCIIVRCFKSI